MTDDYLLIRFFDKNRLVNKDMNWTEKSIGNMITAHNSNIYKRERERGTEERKMH